MLLQLHLFFEAISPKQCFKVNFLKLHVLPCLFFFKSAWLQNPWEESKTKKDAKKKKAAEAATPEAPLAQPPGVVAAAKDAPAKFQDNLPEPQNRLDVGPGAENPTLLELAMKKQQLLDMFFAGTISYFFWVRCTLFNIIKCGFYFLALPSRI